MWIEQVTAAFWFLGLLLMAVALDPSKKAGYVGAAFFVIGVVVMVLHDAPSFKLVAL